jgi:uncharacterized protein
VVYLDSSAIVKLVQAEAESAALVAHVEGRPRISCTLARTEVLRAVRGRGSLVEATAREVLASIDLIAVDDELLDHAARLDPGILRTLDAIHVAAALAVQGELDAVVTYDDRMTNAALLAGLNVHAPGLDSR